MLAQETSGRSTTTKDGWFRRKWMGSSMAQALLWAVTSGWVVKGQIGHVQLARAVIQTDPKADIAILELEDDPTRPLRHLHHNNRFLTGCHSLCWRTRLFVTALLMKKLRGPMSRKVLWTTQSMMPLPPRTRPLQWWVAFLMMMCWARGSPQFCVLFAMMMVTAWFRPTCQGGEYGACFVAGHFNAFFFLGKWRWWSYIRGEQVQLLSQVQWLGRVQPWRQVQCLEEFSFGAKGNAEKYDFRWRRQLREDGLQLELMSRQHSCWRREEVKVRWIVRPPKILVQAGVIYPNMKCGGPDRPSTVCSL